MGYLRYKGYTGSVEYSEEDNCLFGKVLGMSNDSITYEGADVNELRQDFEGAVDDYLASCEGRGVSPRKPFSGMVTLRLSPEFHGTLAMKARQAGTSINSYIRRTLEHDIQLV